MMYKALFYNDNCYIREDKFRLRNTHSEPLAKVFKPAELSL